MSAQRSTERVSAQRLQKSPFNGCVRYLNRCVTSPTYILYRLNEKKWAYNRISSLTLNLDIFLKRRWPAAVSFPQTKQCLWNLQRENLSNLSSFQIMWRIGMSKRIALQKLKQLFGWNRRPDKLNRVVVSFILNTKVCKFNKEDWLQICD